MNPRSEKPLTVSVHPIKNKTVQFIDSSSISSKIKVKLANSNEIKVVMSPEDMRIAVNEIRRQMAMGVEGGPKLGNFEASKFRIEGAIASFVRQTPEKKLVLYNLTLSLVNNQSGRVEWMDEKETTMIFKAK